MDRTQSGARTSAMFRNSVRSLMLVLLTAQPVLGGPEYTMSDQLMDGTGNLVVVLLSDGSSGLDSGVLPG